jgi:hypothetical protein
VLPLPIALSRVLAHITADAEARAGVGATMPSLAVWSNVLRCVADNPGIDEKGLATEARISKRLAVAAVTGAARRGWVETEAAGGKNRRVTLAEAGEAAAGIWPGVLAAVDKEWATSDLRRALEPLVSELRFELPHYPASYGAADSSATGGCFVQNAPRKGDLPAHGVDWKPVDRDAESDVHDLAITALLSQALMAFTIDYEDRFPWPLASTLNVLMHIGDGAPLSEMPAGHGVTGEGKSGLERHLIVDVEKRKGGDHFVTLSSRGKQVMEHHPKRLAAVELEWDERYGKLATDLRQALEPLATGPAADQADYVVAPLHLG